MTLAEVSTNIVLTALGPSHHFASYFVWRARDEYQAF